MSKSKLHIGTSGYSYSYWKNRFYPEKLAASKWLEYYATQFNTLELNNTFYRFPTVKNLQKAAASTPEDFRFAVKAHKIITHTKRMHDVADKIKEFNDIIIEGLGEKLGCILYQLPPSYSFTEERLDDVLNNVDKTQKNVIEFRHISWWNEEVYQQFRKEKLCFCSVSYPNLPQDNISTNQMFYKRMHGVPELFKSSYSDAELQQLAKEIPKRKEVYIFFNNTTYEAGYSNAYFLKGLAE